MKLAPANPNFLQARDGIIQADLVRTSGANRGELWAGFAKRGMGAGATSPVSSTTAGLVESYDLPDDLGVSPAGGFNSRGEVGGPFDVTSTQFTLRNNGAASLNWTAGANVPWLSLSSASGTLAAGATVNVTGSLNAAANSLANGLHTATATFTNTTSGIVQTRVFTLRVGVVDYFTEAFDTSANDTENQSFLFTPNGSQSFYRASRTVVAAFPTDPAGGTALPLGDDTFNTVALTGGATVKLYGASYGTLYVGSNGYVTFGAGDSSLSSATSEHFAYKRIAALMMDLYPSTTAVTWRQLADRVAVTWQNVPVYGTSNSNSLQIEMFFDGRVRITILGIDATGGLIGLSNGAGVPVDFAESDFSSYGSDALLTLTLPVQTVEGAGTLANAGRVSTSYAPSSALVVTLTSNRPDKLAVPATVTIPAGQTSVLFSPVAGDNALLDGTQRATVTATAAEFVTGSASVGVDDNETTALYLLAPGSAVEGDPDLQGIVLLNVAAESDVTVTLISGNPAEAVMPASVLIPAGQNSANFPITVIDDARIDGTVTLGLTAHVANWTDGFATLAIADNEATTLAVTLPGAIREGDGPRSGTVQIPGTLTSALTVALASSDTSELTLPATVTIPAGQTSAAFTATVVDDAEADGAQNATLTVSAAGFTSGTRTVSVADNDAHHFTLSTVGSPQIPNVPFALTVTARDVNDTTITNYNSPVNLTAAGSSGAVPMTPATLTGWTGGVRSGNVAATAFDSGVVLTVDDGQGHSGTSNAFDVVLGPLDHFTFNAVASPQMLDTPFSVDISAVDIGGNRIASFSDAAALSIELSSGASIPIDPASTGGFTGGSWTGQVSSPVAVTNLRLVARNGATLIGKSNAFTVQAPPLPPGTSGSVFTEPFETATLGPWWTVTGTATYRTQVTTANVPHGGLRHLTMDSSSDGTYARNEATLTVNLAGRTGVTMTFWAKSFSDEPNGPPTSPFVGGADFDGVAISADGTNWYEVQALRTLTSTYAQFTVNLDAAIAARGLSYGSSFKIRFNQYDNFAIATDGIGIDDIAITAAVVPTTTLTVPAQAAEGAGPLAGTVTLASTAIADTTVALTSLSPAKVTVPASVLIPAGQSTAGFTFTVLDNTLLDGNRSVTLLADTTGSTSILVVDNETAALSIAVPPSATEGAAALTGTVTLGAVPSGTIVLSLSSSDTTEATVPATVAFAAGQTSATFPITIVNDTLIDGTQTATISVGAAGWTAASGTISVADNESTALTLTAPGVAEGANGTGSVSIAGTMPAPLVVTLTNPSPSELITPATVTIAAGLSSVSFTYTGVDNALKDGTRSITVTASAAGFTSANRTILVADNEVDHFTFGTIASPQIANRTFSTTLEARDVNDVTMTAFTGTVNLTASGVGGAVPVTPASVTLFSGAWSGTLAIAAPRAGVTITASAAGATGASGVFDVGLGALDRFTWSAIASPQVVGAPFTATVTAQDFYSNTVTDFTGAAALSVGTPVRLTGTGASNDAYLFSTSDQQRNQAIYLPSEIGPAGQIAVIAINPNVTSGTGGALTNFTVRMKHTSLTSYVTAAWESTGWTTVYQGNLAVTGTGSFWVNIPLTVPFAYNGTSQLMVDISHNGISTVSANALSSVTSASRMLNFAGSGFADPLTWTGTTSPVPIASAGLPNLRIYLANTLLVTPATTAAFTNGVWTGPIAVNQAATGVALRAASGAILGESNAFTVAGAATMQVTPATGLTSAGTRGGPFTPASTAFTITNTGTIALSWTAAKTASWVTLSTASGSLAAGASASVTASINSNANSLATGAYADTVTFTNVTNGTGNTTRAVSLTANPVGDLTVTPGTNFTATGPFGGPVAPGSKSYTLTNTGDAALNWTASKTSAWLSLSANAGTLAAGASTTVTATIAAAALEPGSYSDILILTNTSTGRGSTTRGVTLGISLPAPTLLPEPPVTGGTGNTVSWSSVFGADLYEVQIATDAAFTTPLSSGWIAGTSHTFTGLADGTAYRYRVRASRTVESAWSGTVSSVQDATSPALTFSSAVATLTASHSVVGMAGDANGIQSVTVNGVSAATADAFLHWTSGATLAPGWNLFTVAASDSAVPANVTTAAHSVYLATATSDADGDGLPDAWELAHGLDLFDATGGSGASADPERDGIPHLLELAFGLDPLVADVSGLPVAAGEIDPADGQTYLTLRYRRLLAPGALIYGIEVSSDLATWSSTAADFEELAPAVATGDGLTETVTIRVKPALTAPGNPARQVRVRVTAP